MEIVSQLVIQPIYSHQYIAIAIKMRDVVVNLVGSLQAPSGYLVRDQAYIESSDPVSHATRNLG